MRLDGIRLAFSLVAPGERWRWLALVPGLLLSALLEAAGAAVVFVLVRLLADPRDVTVLPASLRPWAEAQSPRAALLAIAAGVLAFYIARNIVLVGVAYLQERVIQQSAARVASGLLGRYLAAPYPFHFSRAPASLINAIHENVGTVVEKVLAAVVHLTSEGLVILGLLAVLAVLTPLPALAAIVMTVVLVPVPLLLTRRRYARWGAAEEALHERLLADVHQSLDAVKDILVAGRQEYFAGRYARDREALVEIRVRRLTATSAVRLVVETAFIASMLIAVAVLTVTGRSDPEAVSALGLFAYAGFRTVPSVNRIMLNVNLLRYGQAFVDPLIADWSGLAPLAPDPGAAAEPPWAPFTTDVVFDDVSFAYPGGRTALGHVAFRIPRGASIGIVGATGAGKSTLVDVMLGLLPPTSGRVLVDGRDVRTGVRGWQAQIGYVAQDVVVVDDTLRRNVAFGVDDEAIDEQRVGEAVEAASLAPLVAALPGGLETRLGARGIRLSGGERQRVAIARALYRRPAVLVFDEATSALDNQTEREIVAAIDAVRGHRTVVVIAHRLSTVRHCDRLIVLAGGRIAAEGPYAELLVRSDVFRALVGSGGAGGAGGEER